MLRRPALSPRGCQALAVLLAVAVFAHTPSAEDEPARIEGWAAALKDKDPEGREEAARGRLKGGSKAKAARPALYKALKDEDADARAAASRAVLGIDAALAHDELVRRLGDRKSSAEQRRKACRELARNNWDDEATLAALEEALS